jgi:hypothetical protein
VLLRAAGHRHAQHQRFQQAQQQGVSRGRCRSARDRGGKAVRAASAQVHRCLSLPLPALNNPTHLHTPLKQALSHPGNHLGCSVLVHVSARGGWREESRRDMLTCSILLEPAAAVSTPLPHTPTPLQNTHVQVDHRLSRPQKSAGAAGGIALTAAGCLSRRVRKLFSLPPPPSAPLHSLAPIHAARCVVMGVCMSFFRPRQCNCLLASAPILSGRTKANNKIKK